MSNVVQFLENLARNPKQLSAEDFAAAVAKAGVDSAAYKALMERNAEALNQALGGRLAMMCMIVPAENEEPKEGDEQEGGDETPEGEVSSRAA
ncbi:hypothetical protein [Lysobacter sp. P5_B9]